MELVQEFMCDKVSPLMQRKVRKFNTNLHTSAFGLIFLWLICRFQCSCNTEIQIINKYNCCLELFLAVTLGNQNL